MKKIAILAAAAALLAGCGHNVGMVGLGTGFRVGGQGYGVSYGDGLFGTFVAKDGVKFRADLDSTQGFSYDPGSHTYKGIKSVEYSVAPQITGYAVDFAKDNPEVAKEYYKSLVKYYEIAKQTKEVEKPLVSDEKSKEATTSVADIIKKAVEKAKSYIDGKGEAEEVFVCDGNCHYEDISGHDSITYQMSAVTKLLTYDGYTNKFADTGEYYTTALEHLLTQLVRCKEKGKDTTPMRIKRVKVEDKVITDLLFVMRQDGKEIDTTCPSCWGDISEM